MKQIDDLGIEENGTLRLQPCLSPVWDTALSLIGLADCRVGTAHQQILMISVFTKASGSDGGQCPPYKSDPPDKSEL